VRVPVTLAHPNRMSRSWRTARTALSTHCTVSAEIIHCLRKSSVAMTGTQAVVMGGGIQTYLWIVCN
jgi:hypothetical protein